MVKLYKKSNTRKYKFIGGVETEKYFIQCKNTEDISKWLINTNPLDINQERAIIEALLQDERFISNLKVIVKISESSTIEKEYNIANILKIIPGFILFICKMSCKDNIDRYKSKIQNTTICSNNENDNSHNLLIMPYISGGSMRAYNWINNDNKLISCLSQLIISLMLAFEQFGFLHSDIHLDNVLLRETQKETIKYNDNYNIKTERLQICIMDFDKSFIGVERSNTSEFYKDIQKIFYELMYTMKLNFINQKEIMKFLNDRVFENTSLKDINQLLILVNGINSVNKRPDAPLIYNAYIF
jgi:hypothetical protein